MILTKNSSGANAVLNRCTGMHEDPEDPDFLVFDYNREHRQNKSCCLKYRMIPDNWRFL